MSELPVRAPTLTSETEQFWAATAHGRIELPRCDVCGLVVWYPRSMCPACHGTALTWEMMSGNGTVYSYTISRSGGGRWKPHLPYVLAYVELDEGPRMLTNIVTAEPDAVHIGMAVSAVFDDTGEGNALIRFVPR